MKVTEIEATITDIIRNNINYDFNYAFGIYRDSQRIEGVKTKLKDKFFQFLSMKKDEYYKNEIKKLTTKDKNTILKYLEDIEEYKWIVSSEIILKFKELLQEPQTKK